jgi:hypothetical protein
MPGGPGATSWGPRQILVIWGSSIASGVARYAMVIRGGLGRCPVVRIHVKSGG